MQNVSQDLGVDLRRIQLLAAVRRLGTIAAVAEEQHLTASAVSQQLAVLAGEVGQPLLERRGRGVIVTTTGRILTDMALDIDRRIQIARESILSVTNGSTGLVRIGGFATAISRLLAPAVARVRTSSPGLRVELTEIDPRAAIAALHEGRLYLIVSVDFPGAPTSADLRFERTDLLTDVMDVVLPSGHPLARERSLELGTLADEIWVAPAENEPCAHILTGLCAVAGFTPNIHHRCAEWESVVALVAAGAGVSLVPRLAQPVTDRGATIVPLRGDPASRGLFALRRAGDDGTALEEVRQSLLEVVATR